MNEPDFSGVAPSRPGEARRRIQVIEIYLEIERPFTTISAYDRDDTFVDCVFDIMEILATRIEPSFEPAWEEIDV